MTNKDYYLLTTDYSFHNKINLNFYNFEQDYMSGAFCMVYSSIKENNVDFYLCFRSTDLKFNDLFTNILFFKSEIPYNDTNPNIKVHLGFLNQYKSIQKKLFKMYDRIFKLSDCLNNYNFHFIGHSLGGAIASLAILDFQYNYFEKFKDDYSIDFDGMSFGSPRLGNKYFIESFDHRIANFKRIWISNDLIIMLPFKFLGYQHTKDNYRIIAKDGKSFSLKNHINYDKYLC